MTEFPVCGVCIIVSCRWCFFATSRPLGLRTAPQHHSHETQTPQHHSTKAAWPWTRISESSKRGASVSGGIFLQRCGVLAAEYAPTCLLSEAKNAFPLACLASF